MGRCRKLSSLKFTAALLVAFLLLTFWGVLAQANAESAGLSASVAVDRFFDSYFIWILGVIPLPAFKGLALLGCVNIVASLEYRMPRGLKNAGLWLMHIALLVLLAGGILQSEFKREYNGYAVMKENSSQTVQYFDASDSLGLTPVRIETDSWLYYVQYRGYVEMPGAQSVAMYKAYYDPLHFVPYAFMGLFLLGAVFHYVLKVRKWRFIPLFAVFLIALPDVARASERPLPVWESLHAETPVLVDSAVRPFDSFSRNFLDNLYGRTSYKCNADDECVGKLAARNIVLQILNNSDKARQLRLFKVLRSDVSGALHLPSEARYVSYAEILPSRSLLELYSSRNDNHPATAEMKLLYSNVLRYESVANHLAFSLVDKSRTPHLVAELQHLAADSRRLSVEVFYHEANFALWSFVVVFLSCLLSSVNLICKSKKLDVVGNVFCVAAVLLLLALFAIRAYVVSRVPLSSLYEIVLLVALLLVSFESGAFLFCKRRTFSLMVPVTLMAALLLFFAKFVLEAGDTFLPIPAVLNSSAFLTVHVFTIALGFAGVILSGISAHLVLFRGTSALPVVDSSKTPPLYSLMHASLIFGAVFTIVGTLLGGVWADVAWGRFWGFDPKECGALFVILWTALLLHLRAGRIVSLRNYAVLNAFNVIVVFLCWFGINILGVGLHSYGFQTGSFWWLSSFVLFDLAVIAILSVRKGVVS